MSLLLQSLHDALPAVENHERQVVTADLRPGRIGSRKPVEEVAAPAFPSFTRIGCRIENEDGSHHYDVSQAAPLVKRKVFRLLDSTGTSVANVDAEDRIQVAEMLHWILAQNVDNWTTLAYKIRLQSTAGIPLYSLGNFAELGAQCSPVTVIIPRDSIWLKFDSKCIELCVDIETWYAYELMSLVAQTIPGARSISIRSRTPYTADRILPMDATMKGHFISGDVIHVN